MATGSPIMNGEVPHAANPPGTLEETLQLMNILIQENRDLKGENQGSFGSVGCLSNKLLRGAEKMVIKICFFVFFLYLFCLRSPASDQLVNEGTF